MLAWPTWSVRLAAAEMRLSAQEDDLRREGVPQELWAGMIEEMEQAEIEAEDGE